MANADHREIGFADDLGKVRIRCAGATLYIKHLAEPWRFVRGLYGNAITGLDFKTNGLGHGGG